MATTYPNPIPLTSTEHQVQLRRAVIASTIGTTIEWYDFFLYFTVTGLVFAKLFFPNSDPWVGTLEAFAIYAVGFIARPIGAAIFGHYGDRIGRKSTLIATLLLMGLATFAVALVPTYREHRHLGRGHPHRAALHPGRWRRWRMGRLGADVDGMGAQRQARAGSSPPGRNSACPADCSSPISPCSPSARCPASSSSPGAGACRSPLSIVLVGVGLYIRLGIMETPVFAKLLAEQKIERTPMLAVIKRASEGDPALRLRAHGRAGAVLHLHRLHLLLRHRHAACLARLPADRGACRLGAFVRLDPLVRASSPTGSAARTCT